jgi:hypothetical protein
VDRIGAQCLNPERDSGAGFPIVASFALTNSLWLEGLVPAVDCAAKDLRKELACWGLVLTNES